VVDRSIFLTLNGSIQVILQGNKLFSVMFSG